jgi:hypothetical protein
MENIFCVGCRFGSGFFFLRDCRQKIEMAGAS